MGKTKSKEKLDMLFKVVVIAAALLFLYLQIVKPYLVKAREEREKRDEQIEIEEKTAKWKEALKEYDEKHKKYQEEREIWVAAVKVCEKKSIASYEEQVKSCPPDYFGFPVSTAGYECSKKIRKETKAEREKCIASDPTPPEPKEPQIPKY